MSFLLLCAILANLIIAVCFKLFDRYKVDVFTAIITNYWASAILGSIISNEIPLIKYAPGEATWTYFGIALGFCFVVGFTVTAISIRYAGMAITTAMQRMSLLLSSGYAVIFFGESLPILKIIGMALAVAAIIMITRSDKENIPRSRQIRYLLFPILALLASGIIETVLYHVHAKELNAHGDDVFSTYGFSLAACLGTIVVLFRQFKGLHKVNWRDIVGGIALGVPNFFTIYLILALLNKGMPGSVLYPVLNILVLLLTAITGLYLFKEKLKRVNLIGIGVALLAILLISEG